MLGALACAGLLALPAGAEDTESEELEKAIAVFTLKATHGYSMIVLAGLDSDEPPTRGSQSRGSVIVYVVRKSQAALYIPLPATMTADFIEGIPTVTSIHADLGKLGEMTLAFRPSGGKASVNRPGCTGGDFALAAGSYEGTLEFHGEENYTDVTATSVRQRPAALVKLLCRTERIDEAIGPGLPGARLEVQSRHLGALALQANKNRAGGPVHITVGVEETGAVDVTRSVTVNAPSEAFSFDRRLRHARLSPGGPFSGRAVFESGARPRNRWRGNLTVDLPGEANVRLARPGFKATLEHAVRRVSGDGAATDRAARLGSRAR